jgi:hypothetical protein
MDLHAELARLIRFRNLAECGADRSKLLDQRTKRSRRSKSPERDTAATECAAQTKIQALTLELAHLRRMRFGVRSEALDAETRDLFQETLASDVAAAEAELARRQAEAEETPARRAPEA